MVDDYVVRLEIRRLMGEGVYDQIELFNILYPQYHKHYSKLRELISEEKNYA